MFSESKMRKLIEIFGLWIVLAIGSQTIVGQTYSWAQNSTPNASYWGHITISSNGTKLAATTLGGSIYFSTNSGISWQKATVPVSTFKGLSCMASSSDGQRLVSVGFSDYSSTNIGFIYTSTDSGQSWTQTTAPWENWWSVASSADGKILAATFDYGVMVSTNFGAAWIPTLGTQGAWMHLASSFDGKLFFANGYIGNTNYMFTSTNSGFSWVTNNAPNLQWSGIACTTNGKILAACARLGSGIYRSTNSGATWVVTSAPSMDWGTIASSADGTKLVAGVLNGNIYASFDSGNSWTNTGQNYGTSIASSANGTKLAMTTSDGVFTGQLFAPPQNFSVIFGADSSIKLQFIGLPIYPYILQATSGLSPTSWQPVITNYTDSSGNWSFTDPNPNWYPQRFYRALQQ